MPKKPTHALKSIRDIHVGNWNELRIICIREGVTLSDKLNEIIAKEVKAKS